MDGQKDTMMLLDLMCRPGFCVCSGRIVHVNQAAEGYLLSAGMELAPLLQTGAQEYSEYTEGCLYLTLTVGGRTVGASVNRMEDGDIFLLDQESDRQELQSLALVARELRDSLSSVMLHADHLSGRLTEEDDPDARARNAKMNRGLFQMLRVIGNMSDANRYATGSHQELLTISEEFNRIFEKAQALICHTGIRLNYRGLGECLFSMGDREQLERAVLNILSNALKFTPAGGTIDASLTRRGKMLRLTVEDTGSGMDDAVRANVFQRYLRQPAMEDSRHGVGLGMVLIRSTAANHGGTVLIDQPQGKGTRVTMTMAIRPDTGNSLKSPRIRMDYSGGHDHMLLELSQSLPAFLYETEI